MINPARQLYLNMDIDNLKEDQQDKATGLLAPKKMVNAMPKDAMDQPAYRVARHMQIIRNRREALKNGNGK